jgi:hypothetical protein
MQDDTNQATHLFAWMGQAQEQQSGESNLYYTAFRLQDQVYNIGKATAKWVSSRLPPNQLWHMPIIRRRQRMPLPRDTSATSISWENAGSLSGSWRGPTSQGKHTITVLDSGHATASGSRVSQLGAASVGRC